MMKKEKNLVILAAGIGSRFRGGVKQLQAVGPAGECIMDYSIYDAVEAGFNRIVFIIRRDIETLFEEMVGSRIRPFCEKKHVEVVLAYQDKENLPGGYVCPADRVKPWGTGHALLSCEGLLHGGFVVINADDYYGKEAYRLMSWFLDGLHENSRGVWALAGFRLANTLSRNGGVTRGLCTTGRGNWMTSIVETRNILSDDRGGYVMDAGHRRDLDGNIPVSMNMWAFSPDVLEMLRARFTDFLAEHLENPTAEFLIPSEIGGLVARDFAQVLVLPTRGQWFGMTYSADTPAVVRALQEMTEAGEYPSPLFR